MNHFFGLIPWFVDGFPVQYAVLAVEQEASSEHLKQGFPIIYTLRRNSKSRAGLRDEISVRVNMHICDRLGPAHGEINRLVRPSADLNRAVIRYGLSQAKGQDVLTTLDMMIGNEKVSPLYSTTTTSELRDKVIEVFLSIYDHFPGVWISHYELTLWFDVDRDVLGQIVNELYQAGLLKQGGIGDKVEWAFVNTHHYKLDSASLEKARSMVSVSKHVTPPYAEAVSSTPGGKGLENQMSKKKVFLVHGRDKKMVDALSLLLERQNIYPIVMESQPNQGLTLIEKFEKYADVKYGIVVLAPEDEGKLIGDEDPKPRARQNVIFECGYFMGKLGRGNAAYIFDEMSKIELPSDIHGLAGIPYDAQGSWKTRLGRELKAAGFTIDFEKLVQ